jgi:hypothetical protein
VNGLVTTAAFNRALNVGFALPQATLLPNSAEQVTIITVAPGQRLQLRWLTLHLVRLNSAVTAAPVKVNAALATAYVGLYGQDAELIRSPAGRPLLYTGAEVPGAVQARPSFPVDLSPGTYAVLAVNNLYAVTLEVAVCGSLHVSLPS